MVGADGSNGKRPRVDPLTAFPKFNTDNVKASFTEIGNVLIEESVKFLPQDMPQGEIDWIKKMLDYNVKGGKMNRGLMVLECGKTLLKKNGTPTSDQLTKLCVLGWAVEWLQAWLLIADDIMDESETRRGQKCWYKVEHVKMIAINDSFTLEMLVYKLLKRYFEEDACYTKLVDLFLDTTYNTTLGQLADTRCDTMPLEEFTLDRWTWIAKHKTSVYSFYLPVALGMAFAGIKDENVFEIAKVPLHKMGIYFQAQDDFLDWFADPETLGKIGTDIQDRKCSWLFVEAFHKHASAAQKQMFAEQYGRCKVGSAEEKAIKDVYTELKMDKVYSDYADACFKEINALESGIEKVGLPWSIFATFLSKIHNRSK
jgi:farnesyl diphosphate synthase